MKFILTCSDSIQAMALERMTVTADNLDEAWERQSAVSSESITPGRCTSPSPEWSASATDPPDDGSVAGAETRRTCTAGRVAGATLSNQIQEENQ